MQTDTSSPITAVKRGRKGAGNGSGALDTLAPSAEPALDCSALDGDLSRFTLRRSQHYSLVLQQQGRDLAVGAVHLDQGAHLRHGVDVGFLDETLLHRRSGIGLRGARCRRIEVRALLLELPRVGKIDDLELAADRIRPRGAIQHGDGAVGRNADVMVGRLKHDRSAGAEHGIAGDGDKLALAVDLQTAVAGVTLAGGGLNREKAAAVDRDIQRIIG